MKLTDRILKLTVIFIELTEGRGRFPQNQRGGQQAGLKRRRDDPDWLKKGYQRVIKRIIERFQMGFCTT